MKTAAYIQMTPDEMGKRALVDIGNSLPLQSTGRLLPSDELHVTLIHFGKVQEVLRTLRQTVEISEIEYSENLQNYIGATRALLTDDRYVLEPLSYQRFGERHNTLVAAYTAPDALREIHQHAYVELIRFLGNCGVKNAENYAAQQPHFMYARQFKPHVTLYKSYDGPDPANALPPLEVTFMPLEYNARTANQ